MPSFLLEFGGKFAYKRQKNRTSQLCGVRFLHIFYLYKGVPLQNGLAFPGIGNVALVLGRRFAYDLFKHRAKIFRLDKTRPLCHLLDAINTTIQQILCIINPQLRQIFIGRHVEFIQEAFAKIGVADVAALAKILHG